jgi:hypothetical protein
MKPHQAHPVLARRYLDCARRHFGLAEQAINQGERAYHVAVANEYLSLADYGIRATIRRSVMRSRLVEATPDQPFRSDLG